ncbi:MAG: hypothetical protein JST54_19635 [Deltaproteobacteria bacterium]|nr:hypothetical protein [Deltaproteobacteria bacterium]
MFTATPNAITAGDSSLLSWTVAGATQVTLDPGSIAVAGSSYSVSPSITTTYVLTASNNSGTVSSSVVMTVYPVDNVTVYPSIASMNTEGVRDFVANSSGGVTWSVDEAPNGGAIDATGYYTAPSEAGVFHVRATSSVNPLVSKTAVVSVYFSDAGTLDYEFGYEGTVSIRGPDDAGFIASSVLVDPNHLLLIVGSAPGSQQGLAVRFFLDGGLDSTFGAPATPGYALLGSGTPVRPAPLGFGYAVPMKPSSGKAYMYDQISIFGSVNRIDLSSVLPTQGVFTDSAPGSQGYGSVFISGYGGNAYVASVQLDGGLNRQFGDGGIVSISVNSPVYIAPRSDWGVVAGTAFGSWYDWQISPGGATSSLAPVFVQPNAYAGPLTSFMGGRFVFSALQGSGTQASSVLGMLSPDGGLDPSFGDGGLLALPDMPKSAPISLFTDDRGEIESAWSSSGCAVAQYLADGQPDPAFGGGTVVMESLPGEVLTTCGGLVQGKLGETLGVANCADGSAILFAIWH